MKVLFGYDGSDCARSALNDLRRAGLPANSEVVVLSVSDTLLASPPSNEEIVEGGLPRRAVVAVAEAEARASRVLEESHEMASEAVERLKAENPDWNVRSEAAAGNAAWAIIQRAEAWPADLVVVGSQGRSALGRLIMGSVSDKVATEARCSVRVARCPTEREMTAARILIGVDGSPSSKQAVREVARRSWSQGTEARIVSIGPQKSAGLLPGSGVSSAAAADEALTLAVLVDEAADDLRAVANLRVTTAVIEGDPAQRLLAEANEFNADCIFVGSRGFGNRLERWMLGSVSTALVRGAQCSVEVVRENLGE